MKMRTFIQRHVQGLRVLAVSTEQYVPGVILHPDKKRVLGHCRDVLPEAPEEMWRYTLTDANLVHGTIEAERKIGGGVRVLGVVRLRGRLADDLQVRTEISELSGAFLNTNQLVLQPMLNELRQLDRRGRWRQVRNRFVVMETFYAMRFRASFYRKGELISRLQLEEHGRLEIEGGIDHHWDRDESLLITENQSVPFGVRGFVV